MVNYPPKQTFSIKRDLKKVIAGVVTYSQQAIRDQLVPSDVHLGQFHTQ